MQRMTRSNLVTGAILIALGLMFLVTQALNINVWGVMWPFIIIAVGGVLFFGMLTGGRETAGLALPGSVITTIGLILLFMNLFGHWQAWAYAWTLIMMAVGIGRYIQGYLIGDAKLQREGWTTITVGFLLFVFFGTFFELVIGISGYGGLGGYLWPLLLIGLGAYLILNRLSRPPTEVSETPAATWPEPDEAAPTAVTPMPTALPAVEASVMRSMEPALPITNNYPTERVETTVPSANGSVVGGTP